MTCIMSGGALNSTHSLTKLHSLLCPHFWARCLVLVTNLCRLSANAVNTEWLSGLWHYTYVFCILCFFQNPKNTTFYVFLSCCSRLFSNSGWVSCWCLLWKDSLDEIWETDMALEQGAFGSTIFTVEERRLTLATVTIAAGAHTTVYITRTSQLHAIAAFLQTVCDNAFAWPLINQSSISILTITVLLGLLNSMQ